MEDFLLGLLLLNVFMFLPAGGIVMGGIMAGVSRRKRMTRVAVGHEDGEIVFCEAVDRETGEDIPPATEAPEIFHTDEVEDVSEIPTDLEEPRRSRREWLQRFEEVVGRRWTTWTGVAALFAGAVFFVMYAVEQGWFGPTTRVLMGAGLGGILVGAGERFMRREMGALGKGLIGGGLAIVYLSIFAAYALYALVPAWLAFGLMAVVAAGGMAMSVRHDALPISIISTACGFLVPVMLDTGMDKRDALFAYVLLLDAAVLAVGLFKRWRALDITAFVGTWGIFAVWFFDQYTPPQMWQGTAWLAAFFGLFLLIPFADHWRRRTEVTVERFLMTIFNATAVFALACGMMGDMNDDALGLFTVGMAAAYVLLSFFTGRRIPSDKKSIFAFSALSISLLTIATPILLDLNAVAIAWAVEAVLIAWLAYRYDYFPARVGAFAAMCLAVGKVVFTDAYPAAEAMSLAPFWNGSPHHFLNANLFAGLFVAAAAGAFAWVSRMNAASARTPDRIFERMTGLAGAYLAMFVASRELWIWGDLSGRSFEATAVLPAVWATGFAALAFAGEKMRSTTVRIGAFASLAAALTIAAVAFGDTHPEPYTLVFNVRFAAALSTVLAALGYSRLAGHRVVAGSMYGVFAGGLLLLASAESYLFFSETIANPMKASWTAQMSLSIVWALYAAGALVIGFASNLRPLRLAALGLFGATAIKLSLVDLADLRDGYRIISFVVLGVLMIGASYLYHRAEKNLGSSEAG